PPCTDRAPRLGGARRNGDTEERKCRRAESRELPEPVDRPVHEPVREADQRRGAEAARERRLVPPPCECEHGADQEAEEVEPADDACLCEDLQLEAVRIERLFVRATLPHVVDREVVRADALDGMVLDLPQRDAPEVVAVASESRGEVRARGAR